MLYKGNYRLANLSFLALLVACAYALATLTWRTVAAFSDAQRPAIDASHLSIPVPAAPRAASSDPQRLLALQQAALFGQPSSPTARPVAPPPPTRAPQTRLNIKVQGVVLRRAGRSVAILEHNNQQRAYLEGERLVMPGNVVLSEVQAERILLDRDGKIEMLALQPRESSNAIRASVEEPTQASDSDGEWVNLNEPALTSLLGGSPRDKILKDPLSLGRFLNIAPYQQEGQLQGYQIAAGQDPRLLQRLPIQAGDVITMVDGLDAQPENLGEIYERLSQGDTLSVDILRNGQPLSFNIQL